MYSIRLQHLWFFLLPEPVQSAIFVHQQQHPRLNWTEVMTLRIVQTLALILTLSVTAIPAASADLKAAFEAGDKAGIFESASEMSSRELRNHVHVLSKTSDGTTLLHLAAAEGDADMVKALLRAGADKYARDSDGFNSIDMAIAHGRLVVIEQLVNSIKGLKEIPAADGVFGDPRMIYWRYLYLADQKDKMLSAVEKDLLSNDAHPIAAYIWIQTHARLKRHNEAYSKASPRLKAALGKTALIVMLDENNKPQEALDTFPPSTEFTENDGMALLVLENLAGEVQQLQLSKHYNQIGLELMPDFWQMTWNFYFDTRSNEQLRQLTADLLQSTDLSTALKETLRKATFNRSWGRNDRIKALQAWLEQNPEDPRAHIALGYDLANRWRYEDSLPLKLRSVIIFPWYANTRQPTFDLLRLRRDDQAKSWAAVTARMWSADELEREIRTTTEFVRALLSEGNRGKARELMNAALKRQPDNKRLAYTMAKLELGDKRYAEAISWSRKAMDVDQALGAFVLQDLVKALEADGNEADLLDVYHQAVQSYHHLPESIFTAAIKTLIKQRQYDEAQNQLNLALERLPESKLLLMLQAELAWAQVNKGQAVALMKSLAERLPADSAVLDKTVEYITELESDTAAIQWVSEVTEQHPWNENSWKKLISLKVIKGDALVDFWQNVQTLNPASLFACDEVVLRLVTDRKWNDAWDQAKACQTMAQAGNISLEDRASVERNLIYVIEQQSRFQRLPAERIRSVMAAWREQADKYTEGLTTLYRYEEQICRALNDKECAAQALYQRSLIQPDSTGNFHNLVARYNGELNGLQTKGYGARMVARDPYSKTKVQSFLHKHTKWSGSPIVALKAIQEAEARGLQINPVYRSDALSQLGDPFSGFEKYTTGTTPSGSKRYVDWFHSARRSALTEEPRQIRYLFDQENPGVEIIMPNGEVLKRRDHYLTGKVAYLGRGAGYVKFDYTDTGNLTRVENSSGKTVTLRYNELEKIDQFIAPDGSVLNFVYNDILKPVKISMEGVGSIDVEYDEYGEIRRVNSPEGHQMALKVTQAFQSLLSLVNTAKNANKLESLPSFEFEDSALDRLRDEVTTAQSGTEGYREAQEALAAYLVENIKDSNDYFFEGERIIDDLYQTGRASLDGGALLRAARAVSLSHQLLRAVKPHGLPESDFSRWSEKRNWLATYVIQSNNREAKKILNAVDSEPLALLRDAHWLNRSKLSNTGFWKRDGDEDLFGKTPKNINKQAMVIRRNGDIVVGSTAGLSVLRKGHWEWFGFDDASNRFSPNVSFSGVSASSDVLSLTETEDGVLWVGTPKMLLALSGEYTDEPKRWRSSADGLPSTRIDTLTPNGTSVIAGTPRGLVELSVESTSATAVDIITSDPVIKITSINYEPLSAMLVLDQKGLRLISAGESFLLSEDAIDFAYSREAAEVFWRDDDNLVYARELRLGYEEITPSEQIPELIGRPSDLLMSKQIEELSVWPVPGVGETLVINTDIAINIFHDNYFQSYKLPFEVTRGGLDVGPSVSTVGGRDIAAATSEGVYRFRPSEVRQLMSNRRVYDLLSDDELGLTLVATGNDIIYIDHADRSNYRRFSNVRATHLVQDNNGNLITNDGNTIVQIDRGSAQERDLFSANQSVNLNWWQGNVNDIMVDRNNVVWVAAGSSVFRHENGETREFNYLVDPEAFPSRSQMIYSVYEDMNGDIFATASYEGHLSHEGVDLNGGAMKWNGEGFDNVGDDGHWFVHSYTELDDGTAIVGTHNTIARETRNRRESFKDINDLTFTEMRKQTRMTWLAGQGSKLGEGNSWLFPTAGGVVIYHEGQWLYPDRINQLLPMDQALGQYGARTVHALSVDKDGVIYAGTDLGLLVYHSDGIESLLTDNYRGQMAFTTLEARKHREVSDLFLGAIDKQSPQGKLLARYDQLTESENEIQAQMEVLETGSLNAVGDEGPESTVSVAQLETSLKEKLKQNERRRQRLLARMEQEEPGLFQMLRFDPREAAAMNERLEDNQALVQYLPTSKTLQIQVVTRDGAVIREVAIDRDTLFKETRHVAGSLKEGVLDLAAVTTRGLTARGGNTTAGSGFDDLTKGRLAFLYDALLRPIERDLEGKSQVFITPVGALTYLPFSALIRQVDPVPEYAVERYNIGVLPSLFHYNLVMNYGTSYMEDVLMVSDPDGTLPGARQEVKDIGESLDYGQIILEGEAATLDAVEDNAEAARVIHFATHGILNNQSPIDSYLLLADQTRLSVVDISAMKLDQTDIVVLSACQSGIGATGLEYATLARAFAHARVPTVVASYWDVQDDATRVLMKKFYEKFVNSDEAPDYFTAMSEAQRYMISLGGDAANPSAWSAFTVFGRP